jgi:probable HAF family extracellular repeat protein
MADLGTLGGDLSYAYGINSSGQVVGYAYTADDTAPHAFLYSNGSMTDLNSLIDSGSGWALRDAEAINDLGQIVGYGASPSGLTHAFLLTPIPEPGTLSLVALGTLALLRRAFNLRRAA